MKRVFAHLCAIAAAAWLCSSGAHAQSKFIHTSNASDLTANGNTTVGMILNENTNRRLQTFTRGTGHQLLGPVIQSADGSLEISDDGQFIMAGLYNGFNGSTYWPDASNPFGNYVYYRACCVGTTCTVSVDSSLCTGLALNTNTCSPNPCTNPTPTLGACCNRTTLECTVTSQASCTAGGSNFYWIGNLTTCGSFPCSHGHFLPFRYTVSTNTWANCGSFPNVGGEGATECDSTIATPFGFSSAGRFIVGGGWYGVFATVDCETRGFVFDASNGSMRQLPGVGDGCQPYTQGEYVSTSGLVVMGTDTHNAPDSSICNARCLTVWERTGDATDFLAAGRTILDGYGAGGLGNGTMNRAGTMVAASMSDGQATALGSLDLANNLFKYTRVSMGNWSRTNLGRCVNRDLPVTGMHPTVISDDGGTIAGVTDYGDVFPNGVGYTRPFVWRASINEGVPIDLNDYLASINGGSFPPIGTPSATSSSGNALLTSLTPPPPPCPPGTGLQNLGQAGILFLDGTGIGCEPPRIVGGPYSHVQDEYVRFGIVGNVFVSGSYPLTLQWQKEMPTGSNTWVNLTDSCGTFTADSSWTYDGTTGFQLRVNMLASAAERDGNYRVQISNACGSVTSGVANLSALTGACCYSQGGQLLCTVTMAGHCTSSLFLYGVYLGDNTACSPTACDAVIGACCYGAGGANAACVVTVSTTCEAATAAGGYAGSFAGNQSTCSPATCATVSGACCYSTSNTSDMVCSSEVQAYCTRSVCLQGLGGTYISAGSTCTPTACNSVAGACCYSPDSSSNVICTIQTQTRCTSDPTACPAVPGFSSGLQGIFVGFGTTCLPVNQQCGFVAGACCYSVDDTSNAICTLQVGSKCTRTRLDNGLGGSYRGDGTTCTTSPCTTVTGACCYSTFSEPQTLICTVQPQTRCTSRFNVGGLFGAYSGNNTTCGPTSCASAGACCYAPPGSTCTLCSPQSTMLRCTDPVNGGLGGTWAGAGVACSPSNCVPNEGACCVSGLCSVACATACTDGGGTYQGDGTTCSPDPCNPNPTGACCRGSSCAIDTAANCTGTNTTFAGAGTVCNAPGNYTTPCCKADYNQSGMVTVQDIFDFLAGYFTFSPNADINGSGAVTVQDIFDFLSAYFGGCA